MRKDEAIAKFDSGWWKDATPREIVGFQLYESRLCMPFGEFMQAMNEVMGRPVYTHEMGSGTVDRLKAEFEGREDPPGNPVDQLAAIMLASGRDPDETIIQVEPPHED